MLLLRMMGRNGVGGGTSMQFCAKRRGFVFLFVLFRNRFVDGNLEASRRRNTGKKSSAKEDAEETC
ncbi:hypothetical protein CY35_09G100200 [Sphagnum magellanicum]|nr:hypothetical protein CY35_09G100200 [Sphagnum magellanicum]